MAVVGNLQFLLLTISVCTGEINIVKKNNTHWVDISSFFTIMEKWLEEIEASIKRIEKQDVEGMLSRIHDLERRMNYSEFRFAALEGKGKSIVTAFKDEVSPLLVATESRMRHMLQTAFTQEEKTVRRRDELQQKDPPCINGTCKNTSACAPELELPISGFKKFMEADLQRRRLEFRDTIADFKKDLLSDISDSVAAFTYNVIRKVDTSKDLIETRTTDLIRIMFLGLVERMYQMEKMARNVANSTKIELLEEFKQVAEYSVEDVANTLRNFTKESCMGHRTGETCEDLLRMGKTASGVYTLHLNDGYGPLEVFCDMVTDGGGWVVFQRRSDGSENFYRNWAAYENGFGRKNAEFWLGNLNIHRLTRRGLTKLRVDLQAWDEERAFARYSHFSVGDASTIYKLNVSGYSGTAGDSMIYNSGRTFSTWDNDHDLLGGTNCAGDYHLGAWWHKGCTHANLNGPYGQRGSSGNRVIFWDSFRSNRALMFAAMKVRSYI